MNLRRHDLHTLTGAYAVGALTADELAAFEKHLDQCPSCAEEVRELRETAARLGVATAIAPPPGMREYVLAAAPRTRQLPPLGRRLTTHAASRAAGKRRRWLARPAAVAAATAMAAAIALLAVLQVGTQHQLDQAQAQNRAIAAVLAAPGTRIDSSVATVGGTVSAVFAPRDHEAVITVSGMPAPPGTHVYQLWVINAAGARSAGLLPGAGNGSATPVLATDVQPGDKLGITVEPAGGSAQPTTTPVALVAA